MVMITTRHAELDLHTRGWWVPQGFQCLSRMTDMHQRSGNGACAELVGLWEWGDGALAPHPGPRRALAWMAGGRRVTELRLSEAVVFSPADASTGAEENSDAGARRRPLSGTLLDGVEALAQTLVRPGYSNVSEAIAVHTVFLHPDTVAQTRGEPLFRHVRDMARRDTFGELDDGTPVMFDDNTGPTLGFLWAAQRSKGRDVQYNHIWGDTRNLATYTELWNLCATPAFLAKTTDGSNHPEVVHLFRYRALDQYAYVPEGEERPTKPGGYESLEWPKSPEAVADLEVVFRQRLLSAPRSWPARSARHLGWIFSDGPDDSLLGSE